MTHTATETAAPTDEPSAEEAARAVASIIERCRERLEEIEAAFLGLNRTKLPEQQGDYSLPPDLEMAATINTVVDILLGSGVLSEEVFLARKLQRMVAKAEESLEMAQAHKRSATGLVIADRMV